MNLIIKTRGSQPVAEADKRWAESRFRKLAKLCPPSTVVEVTLEDLFGPKGGRDKKVHVLAELPHAKEPFHLEEVDDVFRKAITNARNRFERHLKRYRAKQEIGSRYPRKFWIQKVLERFRRQEITGDTDTD